jgi:hypothetical protein
MKLLILSALLFLPLVAAATGNKPLAGVANGQAVNAIMWDEVSAVMAGRVVTYAGYKAMQSGDIKDGRLYDIGVAFFVGNPASSAVSSQQSGLKG